MLSAGAYILAVPFSQTSPLALGSQLSELLRFLADQVPVPLVLQNDTFFGNLNWKNQMSCPLRQCGGGGSIGAACSVLFDWCLVLRPSTPAGTHAFLQLTGKHMQKVALNSTAAFIWHLALS